MRKGLAISILVVLAFAAPAVAAVPAAAGPQLIAGSGKVGGPPGCTVPTCEVIWSFDVGLALGAGGGHFTVRAPGFFSGTFRTMCVAFRGNRSVVVGGIGKDLEPAFPPDVYGALELEDNGPGRLDRVEFLGVGPPVPCDWVFDDVVFEPPYAEPLMTGNVTLQSGGAGSAGQAVTPGRTVLRFMP